MWLNVIADTSIQLFIYLMSWNLYFEDIIIITDCLFKGIAKANNLPYNLCAKALKPSADGALKHADDAEKEITHTWYFKRK